MQSQTASLRRVRMPPTTSARGLSVISIKSDGTKSPAMGSWLPYQTDRPTIEEIHRWFVFDNVGVAVIHGAVSGNSELIDIDTADLFGPYCSEVERLAPGLIDRLTIIQTPRPGYHLVYRCDEVEGNQKLAQAADGKTLIETRGQGGYALAPGSPGECHETGRTYDHYSGPELTSLPTITTDDRSILFRVAASFNEIAEEDNAVPGSRASPRNGLSPGDDFNQRAAWCDILTPHSWELSQASGDKAFWRRPNKANGWSATTGAKSTAGNELFCCFSTNAQPFDGANGRRSCTSYSKFATYAMLNHGGDYSVAAKQLASDGYGDRQSRDDSFESFGQIPKGEHEHRYKRAPIKKLTLSELVKIYPTLSPPVIDGLLREGETANLVSVSKVGKSWGVYGMGISIAMGWDWLGTFPTAQGHVLIVDNELHGSTLAHRIPKVAAAMFEARGEFLDHDYEQFIDVWPLRGNLRSLVELESDFDKIKAGYYKLIIFDAKYRFSIAGVSENDNAAETLVYNMLDRYAAKLNTAMLLVHHSSKGDQSGKRITDVGSGAGAQSRAADCHMVLREHQEEGLVVLDAAVRSFPPVESITLKWEFPLWQPCDADPRKLKGNLSGSEQRQAERDAEGSTEIVTALLKGSATCKELIGKTGISRDRLDRLLGKLVADGQILTQKTKRRGNFCDEYYLPGTAE